MRVLGLDFGAKTVGAAVSDPLGLTARPVEIIRRDRENHLRKTMKRIGELIRDYEVTEIVLGYPLNMDDSAGERAEKTKEFRLQLLSRFHLPVTLVDERLTTVEAEEIMREAGIPASLFKEHVDAVAAQIILEDWLNHGNSNIYHR